MPVDWARFSGLVQSTISKKKKMFPIRMKCKDLNFDVDNTGVLQLWA